LVIKPLEEDSTPVTVKPLRVALVEPVAYRFQLHVVYDSSCWAAWVNDELSERLLDHRRRQAGFLAHFRLSADNP
jgi:hypothetical protein